MRRALPSSVCMRCLPGYVDTMSRLRRAQKGRADLMAQMIAFFPSLHPLQVTLDHILAVSLFIIQVMLSQYLIFTTLLVLTTCLKIRPPPTLNQSNFQTLTNVSLDTFLQNGTSKPWFLLFKIPTCKHCQQSQMLFNSFYIQYNKRLHFQQPAIKEVMETDFQFAVVDCEESGEICDRFNIEHYPTYYVVEGNGDICEYVGDRMPFGMITFLQERKKQGKSQKCKPIGKITFLTKLLGYFQPLIEFANYNTLMFIVAFIIGPFLFGYLFSRNKKPQPDQTTLQKQE